MLSTHYMFTGKRSKILDALAPTDLRTDKYQALVTLLLSPDCRAMLPDDKPTLDFPAPSPVAFTQQGTDKYMFI
jgi:hypothetical protein